MAIGVVNLAFQAMANSSVQPWVDPELRGRVMGLYMLAFVGGTPLGGPVIGWITGAPVPPTVAPMGGRVAVDDRRITSTLISALRGVWSGGRRIERIAYVIGAVLVGSGLVHLAILVLPGLAWLLAATERSERSRVRIVRAAAVAYAVLTVLVAI